MINNKDRAPLEYYRARFISLNPQEISMRCSVSYDSELSAFHLKILSFEFIITWPEFSMTPMDSER